MTRLSIISLSGFPSRCTFFARINIIHARHQQPEDGCCCYQHMASSGVSLKHLELNFLHKDSDHGQFDCGFSSSLQTIELRSLSAETANSILPTISSREISTITLMYIVADGIADVDALAALLTSDQFTSLPKLNCLKIEILPNDVWYDRLDGTREERQRVVVAEMDGPFGKLRDVFGERLESEIPWDHFWE